jgi:DNA-directed RNA polymerase subunit RPC12/RpoP
MTGLQEYKCPCCGGAIEFNSDVQKMKCPYCDTEFEMEALKQLDKDLAADREDDIQWDMGETTEWSNSEIEGMRLFVCKSCAGEIIGDENMAATTCPYCGNNVVVMGNFAGGLKPDLVIPFKLNKEAAVKKMAEHLTGKKLLPKVFKEENHIEEIQGVYVPFWLYSADVEVSGRFKGTKVRTWSDGKYAYTQKDHYSITREATLSFEDVPVDASTKMADDLMDSLEPYDYKAAVPFQTAYLAGYMADKYDVSMEDSKQRSTERIKSTAASRLQGTVTGYSTITDEHTNIRLNSTGAKYALLPAWILNTKWNDRNYTFAMNGQTGKFVGNLPMDKSLKTKYFWSYTGVTAGSIILLSLILQLLKYVM